MYCFPQSVFEKMLDGRVFANFIEKGSEEAPSLALKLISHSIAGLTHYEAFLRSYTKKCGAFNALELLDNIKDSQSFLTYANLILNQALESSILKPHEIMHFFMTYGKLSHQDKPSPLEIEFHYLFTKACLSQNMIDIANIFISKLNYQLSDVGVNSTFCHVMDCKWILFKKGVHKNAVDFPWPAKFCESAKLVEEDPSEHLTLLMINQKTDPKEILDFLDLIFGGQPAFLDRVLRYLIHSFIMGKNMETAKELLKN